MSSQLNVDEDVLQGHPTRPHTTTSSGGAICQWLGLFGPQHHCFHDLNGLSYAPYTRNTGYLVKVVTVLLLGVTSSREIAQIPTRTRLPISTLSRACWRPPLTLRRPRTAPAGPGTTEHHPYASPDAFRAASEPLGRPNGRNIAAAAGSCCRLNGPQPNAPPGDLTATTRATAAPLSVPRAPHTSPAECARLRQRVGAATAAVLRRARRARGSGRVGVVSAAFGPEIGWPWQSVERSRRAEMAAAASSGRATIEPTPSRALAPRSFAPARAQGHTGGVSMGPMGAAGLEFERCGRT